MTGNGAQEQKCNVFGFNSGTLLSIYLWRFWLTGYSVTQIYFLYPDIISNRFTLRSKTYKGCVERGVRNNKTVVKQNLRCYSMGSGSQFKPCNMIGSWACRTIHEVEQAVPSRVRRPDKKSTAPLIYSSTLNGPTAPPSTPNMGWTFCGGMVMIQMIVIFHMTVVLKCRKETRQNSCSVVKHHKVLVLLF